MKIASNQRQQLDFLRSSLDDVEKSVGRDMRQRFRDLRTRLDAWAAKVAVIGQVKAGKSTFLNAFLYSHDLLPSHVNPWTSVVTNIRLNVPGDPVSGARFEFFAEHDWQEIAAGQSKIRKLTEQLLPGFDTELLRKQSDEMRARAESRLGSQFEKLLGTSHDYDFVSADLLKTYVCAGPGSEASSENDALGRYASLTKVADIYTRLPEFQVPTIITDTPGVNDPFLVRDEFTCRSLDKSDVFIVVLSAHQPLTEVDIALIRILAKQDSKDVLIFVNRIDELDDYDTDVPRVLDDVSRRLRNAIPDIDFTIVAGSGYMADLTLQEGAAAEAERKALDDARLERYLKARYGIVPNDRCDRLFLASGLQEVKAALSTLIDDGVGGRQLAQLTGDIRAELDGSLFVTRRERDSIQSQVASVTSEVAGMAAEDLQAEIDTIKHVQRELEDNVDAAEARIEKVLSKSWSRLETRLVAAIETFVAEQEPMLRNCLFSESMRAARATSLEIDVTPLQEPMEREVAVAWEKSRAGTDVALNTCLSASRQCIRDRFEDMTDCITLSDLPYEEFASTLTLAKRSVTLNLIVNRGWAFWRKPEVDIDKTLSALLVIAAEALRPALKKLLTAFNEAQVERASAGSDRIRVMLRMFETSLTERVHRLKKDKVEFEVIAKDPDIRARMVQRLQSNMEVLERRLITLSAIQSALASSEVAKAA